MKTGILAIYDADSNYANSLMEYISDKRGMPFKTIAFTNEEALKEYASKKGIDVLLISASSMKEEIASLNIGKIILLTEGKVFAEYIGYSSLYKYQSTENIIREVMTCYAQMKEEGDGISVSVGDVEVIGVYSPVGRSGKTTLAVTLGEIMAGERETLYINMEEFAVFGKDVEEGTVGDLSDIMYYFKQNPESLGAKLRAVVSNIQGLDYIPPMAYSADLRKVDSCLWIDLIKAIATTGMYQVIVIDIGSMVEDLFEMLELCNVVFTPVIDDCVSKKKVEEYEKFLTVTKRHAILDKTVKINVPLEEEREWNKRYYEERMWTEVGDSIRRVLKEIGINEGY